MSPRLFLAAAVFAALALGVSPAHWWLDSGELTAAGAEWGVSHPPGAHGLSPLLLLGTGLGLGSMGFRMGLVCAALGTAAIMLLADIAARRGVREPWLWWMAAWIVLGLTFARNVRVVEIYGLSAVLTFATLWGFDPTQVHGAPRATSRVEHEGGAPSGAVAPSPVATGPRLVAVAAATLGTWGFGDLRLILPPLLATVWLLGLRRRQPWVAWAPIVALFASLPAASTWLASQAGPTVDWGNPQTLAAWWDHVTARSIREAFAQEMFGATLVRRWVDASGAAWRMVEDVGWIGVILAPLAVVSALRDASGRAAWGPWVFVLVGQAGYAVFVNPMGGDDRQTGLVAAMIVVLLVVTWLAERASEELAAATTSSRRTALVGTTVAFAIATLVQPAMTSWGDAAATRSWMPHAWTVRALEALPPRALLLSQSDDLSAGVLAARAVEGARPDVVWATAQHLHKPGPDHAWPETIALLDAARAGRSEPARVQLAISAVGRGRSPGIVALESPATGVLAEVDELVEAGPLPVAILATSARSEGETRIDALLGWGADFDARSDRMRLAHALVTDVEGHLNRAFEREHLDTGRLLALEEELREAIEVSYGEHVGALVDAALLADRRGARDEAVTLIERALDVDPHRASALVLSGRFEGSSSDPEVAQRGRARIERAVALEPRRAAAWRALAEVCATQGDEECAARARAREGRIE